MSSLKRKIKRNKEKQVNKTLKKDIAQKIGLFNKIEDHCLMCEKEFDKTNKDQVQSWYVVVRKENVNIYCPPCWESATAIAEKYSR